MSCVANREYGSQTTIGSNGRHRNGGGEITPDVRSNAPVYRAICTYGQTDRPTDTVGVAGCGHRATTTPMMSPSGAYSDCEYTNLISYIYADDRMPTV